MMAEIAVPVTLTLLCGVNPLLLAIAPAALGAHEATALIWAPRHPTGPAGCQTAFVFRRTGRRIVPIERSLLCCSSSRSCCSP